MENKALLDSVFALEGYLKQTRGYLHLHPEVSAKEFETTKFLQEEVAKIGLPITLIKGTGFYALLDTGKPGKTIALRTDIDALPMEESPNNLKGPKQWVSLNKGVSHTCGHDGHMAMMLSTMKILAAAKNQLTGKIYFLFEEGEEIGSGIQAMLDSIKDLGIDAIYGTHVTSFMPSGKLCLEEGPKMAGAVVVEFDIKGKGGHGSRPDFSINPIFATAQVLSGITSAWSNRLNVEETVTLGLTQIHAGTVNNIIPESCFVGGSLRYYNRKEAEHAIEVLKNTIINTAKAHYCEADVERIKLATVPVINDPKVSAIAVKGVNDLLPGHVISGVKWYASESFSRYATIAPSCFAFLGVGNAEVGSGAEHHNICFDLDEDALKYGVAATVKFAVDYLNS